MNLISVNIGVERVIRNGKTSEKTGIYKFPASGPVSLSSHGFAEDVICDTKNHGGTDQAIYVYGAADYQWWANKLGHEIKPGTFGENLTISELESTQFQVGDFLIVGPVTLQVTSPRIPCGTLAARMGDPGFAKRFREAERPGFYCRVIQTGEVQTGNLVHREIYHGQTVSILEMFRDHYKPKLSEATLRRYLYAPIGIRDQVYYQKRLQKFLDTQG